MPENTNNEQLYLFFTQKGKLEEILYKAAELEKFEIKVEDIIKNWEQFENDQKPFVYCIDDCLEVNDYDKSKLNKSEYVLVHDNYNGELDIGRPFVFFNHSQTNKEIIEFLKRLDHFKNNITESFHEREINGEMTPYYRLSESIVKYFKNKNI